MKKNDWIICLSAAFVWLILASWNLSLPGLQYDECLAAAPAVNFVYNINNTEPMQINPSVIYIFGRPFPVMIMSYIGPIKTLLHIPIFALFGTSPVTVRLLPILVVFLCFPLTYYLCKNFFGTTVAKIAICLIAVDPGFVFYLTRDVGPSALQVFFKLGAITLFYRWWINGKPWRWFTGMFILGLGISHKVDFLWIVGGIFFSIVIILKSKFWERLNLKLILFGLLFFCFGALPIVVFNIATGGFTFTPFISKLTEETTTSNISFYHLAMDRFLQLLEMLNGQYISKLFTDYDITTNILKYFLPLVFILSFIINIILLIFKRDNVDQLYVAGLIIFIFIVFFASCFSPTKLTGHHLLALYPMLHIIIAIFIGNITRYNTIHKYYFDKFLITIILVVSFSSVISIQKNVNTTGGSGSWSDAIYELNDYLENRNQQIVSMEWGFTNNLIVLSKGNLTIKRAYKDFWEKGYNIGAIETYINKNYLYLFHTPKYENFQVTYDIFLESLNLRGYNIQEDRVFYQRNGEKIYTLYSIK